MALAKDASLPPAHVDNLANDKPGESTSRLRLNLPQSDIRELNRNVQGLAAFEATRAFELFGDRLRQDWICPPTPGFDIAIGQYAHAPHQDLEVLHALRIGDLQQAVASLMGENLRLHEELAASRADFEGLRSANVANQELADEAMAVADDQRVELLDELERTRRELLDLDCQLEQARHDYETDLTDMRQQRDALELENFELRARLSDSQRVPDLS